MPERASSREAINMSPPPRADEIKRLKVLAEHCQTFQGSVLRRSLFQLTTTALLFLLSLAGMLLAFEQHWYWMYALLLLPAAGLLVRLFIIQHDCGHGSYFHSRHANDAMGRIISLFTFIPYSLWKRGHNLHHAGSGNLDRRGTGDVDTLTVREYQSLSSGRKLLYRLYRHPLILLVLGPPLYILFMLRFPPLQSAAFLQDFQPSPVQGAWGSAMVLNALLVLFYGAAASLLGWQSVLFVYLPVLIIAFWAGQWLFFVQHQFEKAYWQPKESWNYYEAAIYGSSFYPLHPILQWFTGNIGFHHIHHLCPGIPNYRLQECFEGNSDLAQARQLTLRESLKSIHLALWDEAAGRMIGFGDLKRA